ncbi:MAG TPA: hypothetical protein VFH54_02060 [Mycobacteriales bacterium]|nr:hypothetical protein [Mycobacteriales bacterium]
MRPTRAVAIAIAAGALLAACGPQAQLRMNLRTVAVTVPRVVAPAVQLVPPSAPPPAALPPIAPLVNQLPPATATVPPVTTKPNPCPPAPPFATPAHPASETVGDIPASQSFVQRATGDYTNGSAKGSLAGDIRVTVTDLPDATSSNGQRVKSWRVQQVNPATKTRSVEVYQLAMPSNASSATPAGVYLVGLAWTDPVRGTLTFQPSGNGLYVLPSPVQVASNDEQYAGIATDPNTLTTLQLIRNVRERKRIDVCGQVVDTWTVEMSGTLTSPSAQWTVTWDQQIATAYGAADIDELFGLQDPKAGGPSWTRRLISTTVPKGVR